MKFVLKICVYIYIYIYIVLKTKTNLHFVNQKFSKWKEKKWTKVPVQLKKKNHIEKFETQLEKMHCRTGTGRRHRSYKQGERQNVDVKV